MTLGGIGKLTLNLIKEFTSKGVEVDLFLLKGGGEYFEKVPDKARIFIAEGNNFKRIIDYLKYLNTEQPDVSISSRQRQDLVNIVGCLLSFSKTKPIISVHTNVTEENKHSNKGSVLISILSRLLYKIPEKFIAVSQGVAKDLTYRTGVDINKIKVIYNPVYQQENLKKNQIDTVYDNFLNKKFIIAAARFTEQKDLFTLINAFNFVRNENDISLVLLGDGPQRESIEKLIDNLSLTEHVLLTGYVDNPEYFIKRASAYILSSKWEGFGNVLVEAMGVGTPVVSTDCPSGPAEILQNGTYGELVPVEDPQELAKAIIRTLNNPIPSDKLKQRAKDFAVPKIADEYLDYCSN